VCSRRYWTGPATSIEKALASASADTANDEHFVIFAPKGSFEVIGDAEMVLITDQVTYNVAGQPHCLLDLLFGSLDVKVTRVVGDDL
jgi:hypothetical protein